MCPALAVLGGSGHRGFSLLEEGPPCLTSGSLPDVVCGERNGLLLPGKARSRNFGGVRFAQNLLERYASACAGATPPEPPRMHTTSPGGRTIHALQRMVGGRRRSDPHNRSSYSIRAKRRSARYLRPANRRSTGRFAGVPVKRTIQAVVANASPAVAFTPCLSPATDDPA